MPRVTASPKFAWPSEGSQRGALSSRPPPSRVAPMADEVEAVEEVDLASLPDALLLHVLESLGPSIADLGRCRCVSTRFSAITAEDEGVWRAACAALFGLETSPSSPDGDACTSFFTAARAWSSLRCVRTAHTHTDAYTHSRQHAHPLPSSRAPTIAACSSDWDVRRGRLSRRCILARVTRGAVSRPGPLPICPRPLDPSAHRRRARSGAASCAGSS